MYKVIILLQIVELFVLALNLKKSSLIKPHVYRTTTVYRTLKESNIILKFLTSILIIVMLVNIRGIKAERNSHAKANEFYMVL